MNAKVILLVAMAGLLSTGISKADFVQSPIDDLAADTVDMVVAVAPDASQSEWKLQLDLYLFSDGNNLMGTSMGFEWDSPNLQMDSSVLSPLALYTFDLVAARCIGLQVDTTNAHQRFLFTSMSKTAPCLEPYPQRRLMVSYYFTMSDWSEGDSIVIDTLCWDGASYFELYRMDPLGRLVPYWTGRKVIYDTPATCCVLRTGDANCSGNDEPTIGDLNRLVDFLFLGGDPLCCIPEADINQSGGANPTEDDVTISDVSYLQDYLFITGPSLGLPDCM